MPKHGTSAWVSWSKLLFKDAREQQLRVQVTITNSALSRAQDDKCLPWAGNKTAPPLVFVTGSY